VFSSWPSTWPISTLPVAPQRAHRCSPGGRHSLAFAL
jgi:hypothetical protein